MPADALVFTSSVTVTLATVLTTYASGSSLYYSTIYLGTVEAVVTTQLSNDITIANGPAATNGVFTTSTTMNGTSSAVTSKFAPAATTTYTNYNSVPFNGIAWWASTDEGKAIIAFACLTIVLIIGLMIWCCICCGRRRFKRRMREEARRQRSVGDGVSTNDREGMYNYGHMGQNRRFNLRKKISDWRNRPFLQQSQEDFGDLGPKDAELLERKMHSPLPALPKDIPSTTSTSLSSLKPIITPIIRPRLNPDLESQSQPPSHLPSPIRHDDTLATLDVENTSRNKYRIEDFDLPLSKARFPAQEATSGTEMMVEPQVKMLRNRMERIREERERLERIQELEGLERRTELEIGEAERRAKEARGVGVGVGVGVER